MTFSDYFLKLIIKLNLGWHKHRFRHIFKPTGDPVCLLSSFDRHYLPPFCVMLTSLLHHLPSTYPIDLYLTANNLAPGDIRKIEEKFISKSLNIHWLNVNSKELQDLKISHHVTQSVYNRLLMFLMLPKKVKKILYLDCDLIINDSIVKIWRKPHADRLLWAVPELSPDSRYASSLYGLKAYKKLGIKPNCLLINSGVMLINLNRWRKMRISQRVIQYLRDYKDDILWWDQDGINAIIRGKFGILEPKWNVSTQVFNQYPHWKNSGLKRGTFFQLIFKPSIIHFNTGSKPWHPDNHHPYKSWYDYFAALHERF